MQSPNTLVTIFARNLLKLCHQHQKQGILHRKFPLVYQSEWIKIDCSFMHSATRSLFQPLLSRRQEIEKKPQLHHQQIKHFLQTKSNHSSFVQHKPNSGYIVAQSQCSTQLLRSYCKFTTRPTDCHLLQLPQQPLTAERATEFILCLKDTERDYLKQALDKYEAIKLKEKFVGTLAATQWRTRFGRPTKLRSLGDVDPTGTFCAFPDDWLKQKAVQNAKQPTRSELWKLFMVNAAPFIGFGFLDNFTMIIAGDYIETTLGYFMTLSTMAAAGLGNTISDVLGIGSAFYVERVCELMGLRPPELTAAQMELKSSRKAANYGRIIGITIGCLVGMFPLLFMDKTPSDKAHPPPAK